MDPNQNTHPNYRNRKPDNAFTLDTTLGNSRPWNHLKVVLSICFKPVPLSNKQHFSNNNIKISRPSNNNFNNIKISNNSNISNHNHHKPLIRWILFRKLNIHHRLNLKRKKGKKSARPTTTQERLPWTKGEEEKLVEVWISASQDPIEGDCQTYGCFWEKVRAVFYELMGSENRNPGQISSKWRDIRLKCTEFEEIYNNLLNIRKNGSKNFDVFKAALDQFEKITPTCKAFPYLKDSPKWKEQTERSSQSSGSKHSRNPDATSQQLDERTHFEINNNSLDLENEQPLHQPVGRNKAKKAASTALRSSVIDQFGEKFDRYVHVQKTNAKMLSRVEQKTIETQSVIQTKNQYGNLENKSTRPRRRRFGAISRMKEFVRVRRRNRG
uniref:Myb-like domain-containing protein n=1 Tax=Lactuca sativa TaxID=4236 RepID=A0A9R1VM85_LACSA|nr:hypothetical protein LSAT_V11C400180400 [Lactuca sativa]